MNADATSGVTVEAVAGARFGFVLPVAIGAVVGGAILLLVSFAGIVAAARRGRRPPPPAVDATGSVPSPA